MPGPALRVFVLGVHGGGNHGRPGIPVEGLAGVGQVAAIAVNVSRLRPRRGPDLVIPHIWGSPSSLGMGELYYGGQAIAQQGRSARRTNNGPLLPLDRRDGHGRRHGGEQVCVEVARPFGWQHDILVMDAPSTSGTYCSGARVNPVLMDSNTTNSCSSTVEREVGWRGLRGPSVQGLVQRKRCTQGVHRGFAGAGRRRRQARLRWSSERISQRRLSGRGASRSSAEGPGWQAVSSAAVPEARSRPHG